MQIQRNVRITATTQGVDEAARKLDGLAQAQNGVTRAADTTTRATESYERKLNSIQRSLDANFRAQEQMARVERDLARAREQGLLSQQRQAELLDLARQRYGTAAVANDNFARATGNSGAAVQQLGFQINDLATQIASGGSPFQALAQQGGQIMQVYQQSPTVFGDTARAIGGILTPARLVGATVLGGAVAAFAAYERWQGATRELDRALVGTGRSAGVTRDQLISMAEAAARANGGSAANMRGTVGALANTGRIAPDMITPIATVQRDLMATLAMDATEANRLLAESFRDPIRGAERLNDALGGVNERTRANIASLVASGRQQEAQRALLDAIIPRLGRSEELTSFWARSWNALAAAAGAALDVTGQALDRVINGRRAPQVTPQQAAVDRNEREIQLLENQRREIEGILRFQREQNEYTDQLRRNLEQVNQQLERQRGNLQQALTIQQQAPLTVQAQAEAARLRAEQNRAIEGGTAAARQLGLPDQAASDRLRSLIDDFNRLRAARDALYQRQGEEGGFDRLRENAEALSAAGRAIRESTTGVLNRRNEPLFDLGSAEGVNRALQQRQSIIDGINERNAVDRQQVTAITAAQRASAAAAQERQRAIEQGAAAGTQEAVNVRARNAADLENLQIQTQLSQAARERIRAANDNIASVRLETQTLGASVGAQERARYEQQLITDAKREYQRLGLSVPQAEIDAYRALARAMGEARQQQAELRLGRDLQFEREQFGRSDIDRQVATRLRSVYGDDYRNQMNGALAGQMRFNAELERSAQLASDFASSFVNDLAAGRSVTEALTNGLARMGQRLLQMAMDQAIRQLFANLGGGGGFNILSLFGLGGGGGFTFGAGGYYGAGPFMPSALGNAFNDNGVIPFARGGAFTNSIVDRPTLFPFANGTGLMGEAGPEAIMPLRRDGAGRLGVVAQGGGGAVAVSYSPNVQVSVAGSNSAPSDIGGAVAQAMKAAKDEFEKGLPAMIERARRRGALAA